MFKLGRKFFLLWQGHFVSSIGTVIYGIALNFYILQETGSVALMGFVAALLYVPRAFISPFAGVLVDRLDKRFILITADFISGVSVVIISVISLFYTVPIWVFAIVAALLGTTQVFFTPATQASIPFLVSKEQLSQANSAYSTTRSGSQFIGRLIGGYLFSIVGVTFSFLFNGLSFLFSAISEFFLPSLKTETAQKSGKRQSVWTSILEGVHIITGSKPLVFLVALVALLNFSGFMVIMLYVPLFETVNKLGSSIYGLVLAMGTLGFLIGGILFSTFTIVPKKRLYYFAFGGFCSNILIALLPYFNNIIILALLSFFSGLLSTPINIVLDTLLQINIAKELQGRVFALVGAVGTILVPISMVIGGILAELVDIRLLISINAIVISLAFLYPLLKENIRHYFSGKSN